MGDAESSATHVNMNFSFFGGGGGGGGEGELFTLALAENTLLSSKKRVQSCILPSIRISKGGCKVAKTYPAVNEQYEIS